MHILIRLRQDGSGYPPFQAEEIDVEQVDAHTFRLKAPPSFAFGLAVGDLVRAQHYETDLWVEELLQPSGHSTVRLIALNDHTLEEVLDAVLALGCATHAGAVEGLVALDVPPAVNFEDLRALLVEQRTSGVLDFSVGVQAAASP